MIFKTIAMGLSLSIIIAPIPIPASAVRVDEAIQVIIEELAQWRQKFQQEVLTKVKALLFSEIKSTLAKHNEEIKWCMRNYAENTRQADAIISTIKDEVIAMVAPKLLPMMIELVDTMPIAMTQEEKEAEALILCREIILHLRVIEASLKEAIITENTMYTEMRDV